MASVHLALVPGSQIAKDLSVGGVRVGDCALAMYEFCDLVVEGAGQQLTLPARVVYADGNGGAGLELIDFGTERKAALAALIEAVEAAQIQAPDAYATERIPLDELDEALDLELGPLEPPIDLGLDDPDDEDDDAPDTRSMRERLRGLTLADQIKRAHAGDATERIMLERMYGKNVWEALLRNPKLTAPEVARISRMGTLPRTLLELVVGNSGWLQIPEVRRALLSNPRLGADQILRVLKLMPKHELKVASTQTAYPHAVRDAAKRLLRANGA